jgi:hypothetical protein
MKTCGYCGAQNDYNASQCGECGNPFPADSPSWHSVSALTSPLASEIATGAGVFLIIMALFFAVGRVLMEEKTLLAKLPNHYGSSYTFVTSLRPAPFIALAVIYPVFLLFRARFGKSRATRATILIALLACILSLLPRVVPIAACIWCLPASLVGSGSNSSLGYYFGVLVQMAFGALLLVRFRPQRSVAELNQCAV